MKSKSVQKRVGNFWNLHSTKGKTFTVNHFKIEGYAKSTIYRYINTIQQHGHVERKSGSGGHNKKLNNSQRAAIVRSAVDKRGVSARKIAKKYNVCEKTIRNVFNERGVKKYKRTKAPMYTNEQMVKVKSRAKKLNALLLNKTVVMDDESYFKLKCDYIPGNDHFYTQDITSTPLNVKYRTEKKFPIQLMVWICISKDAISEPVFLPRPLNMNAEFYQKKCITAKLLPFINTYHKRTQYIFWPDLATSHYAAETLNRLRQLGIPYVPKDCNPPNLPQCRPIENFWSLLKNLVYEGGWEATNTSQLERRIKKKIKLVDMQSVRKDFESIRTRLRSVSRNGPYSCI